MPSRRFQVTLTQGEIPYQAEGKKGPKPPQVLQANMGAEKDAAALVVLSKFSGGCCWLVRAEVGSAWGCGGAMRGLIRQRSAVREWLMGQVDVTSVLYPPSTYGLICSVLLSISPSAAPKQDI